MIQQAWNETESPYRIKPSETLSDLIFPTLCKKRDGNRAESIQCLTPAWSRRTGRSRVLHNKQLFPLIFLSKNTQGKKAVFPPSEDK
ncbi:hypothetical protein TNIN_247171 [Trichonephila inaurata madagascariensis]|uniref:Uncharacterized protein n=1 Tax=Trichonephila inaurata madagascariensis TaxID=2747483 RepID=A0A8X7BQK3_9ARAC|nr:hypothetical protein TNIN_247171 [Trichonephila inaurata madagascariensis]